MGAHEQEWQIGIVGTFDVENYGDLLFPFLAERELGERLGNVCLHRFSYCARSAGAWPYPVTSVADLPRIMPRLDGMGSQSPAALHRALIGVRGHN